MYKIITKTNLGFFKKGDFTVSRRFSDFLGLYEKLVEKHLAAGRIVPPAPEKNVVGMTKVGDLFYSKKLLKVNSLIDSY